jgi:hypothetical protein
MVKNYLTLFEVMCSFAKQLGIPMQHNSQIPSTIRLFLASPDVLINQPFF